MEYLNYWWFKHPNIKVDIGMVLFIFDLISIDDEHKPSNASSKGNWKTWSHPATRVSIAICEKRTTGHNGSHTLCYYSLTAEETLHEAQFLALD